MISEAKMAPSVVLAFK